VGGAANNGYADNGVQRGITAPTGSAMRFALPNQAGATVPRLVQATFSLECWFKTSSGYAGPNWWNTAPFIMADAPGTASDFGLSLSLDGRLLYGEVNPPR
jgi:hypothetical protein